MKVTLPENISEITLQQYQRFNELEQRNLDANEFNRRVISLFTNIKYNDTKLISNKDFDELSVIIDNAINTDAEFKNKFTLNDITFGFIPNFDKITVAEFVDLSLYPIDKISDLHKLMAILFRPIVSTNKKGDYLIESYENSAKYSEIMKQAPLNVVKGAIVFFCNLAKQLETATQKYTIEQLAREQEQSGTLKNGVGILQLKKWLITIIQRLREF